MSRRLEEQGPGEQPRKAGRPAEAVERAAEGRGGVTASARGGHRRGEPGGSGHAGGAGALPTTQSYRSPMRARSDETPLARISQTHRKAPASGNC